jgi:hypothetical protein
MLLNTYATLKKVYGFEVDAGTFTGRNGRPDGNFERLISVAMKLTAQISERDRYYRAWIGLLLILSERQLQVMTCDPAVLKAWIHEQWDTNADVVPDDVVHRFARDFQEVALCDYLGNLARIRVVHENKK